MKNKLQQHFPMIRTRDEIMAEIKNSEKLQKIFFSWNEAEQQEFLDFCTGVRGIKILYDSFGSITNFVGFRIPLVATTAHIE